MLKNIRINEQSFVIRGEAKKDYQLHIYLEVKWLKAQGCEVWYPFRLTSILAQHVVETKNNEYDILLDPHVIRFSV